MLLACRKGPGIARPPSLVVYAYFFSIIYLITFRDFLGEFEHVVLLALLRLGNNAYGVMLRREIKSSIDRDVSIGAIYATLDRLEAKGYVTSHLGDPTPERGGRSKRYFRVSGKGIAAVHRTHRALRNMAAGVRTLERLA
jgi:PadR family transcriptional regulator, regulatory protein PadR